MNEQPRVCDEYKGEKSYMMENNFLHYFPAYVEWLEEKLEEMLAVIRQTRGVGDSCRESDAAHIDSLKADLATARVTITNLRNELGNLRASNKSYDWDYVPEYDRDDR